MLVEVRGRRGYPVLFLHRALLAKVWQLKAFCWLFILVNHVLNVFLTEVVGVLLKPVDRVQGGWFVAY